MSQKSFVFRYVCGVTAAILITAVPVYAAVAPPDHLKAGGTLSDLKKSEVTVPKTQRPPQTDILPQVKPPMAADQGLQVYITDFKITGDLPVAQEELLGLLKDSRAKDLSLAQMDELAGRITRYLKQQGYLVARAYLPVQEIKDGVLEIAVVTGRYDEIVIHNETEVDEHMARYEMGSVRKGAYIEKKALERALWLVGDLAGAEAKATLASGGKPGTSKLIVSISPKGRKVSGSISQDNYGNRFSGREQGALNAAILNPAGRGDTLAINGATTGSGLNSGGISYKVPAFAPGGKLEFGYSKMRYSLQEQFTGFTGIADTSSLTYTQNFLRSRQANLYGQVGYNAKDLYDDSISGNYKHNKSRAVTVSLNGDTLDDWGGGGINAYSLIYTTGSLDLLNTSDADNDSATAQSKGSFQKWNAFFVRQQHIDDRLSALVTVNGQLADKNLDSSEKMSLGGPYGVRAYPKGEASGDQGYQATAELRWTIPVENRSSLFQLVGFFDAGAVTVNKHPWTIANNHKMIKGAGLGIIWNEPGDYSLRLHYAWKAGSAEATSDTDRNGRLWVQVTKYF